MIQTFDEYDLAAFFLRCLRGTRNPEALKIVVCWKRQESGHRIIGGNPFNVDRPATFPTVADGVRATAGRLLTAHRWDGDGYENMLRAFDTGAPLWIIQAINQSSWSADRYGTTTGGKSRILIAYEQFDRFLIDEADTPLGPLPNMNPEYV